MPDNKDITYTMTYLDNGKTVIITDPKQRESKVEKNNDGRVFKVTDAAGNITEYFYEDGRGNATRVKETVKSADGAVTETYETHYEYNGQNKIEKITDPLGNSTSFYYDNMGNLTGTVDAETNTINHEYDSQGRRTKTIKHLAGGQTVETTFEYYPINTYNPKDTENPGQFSPANRLKLITDAKGNETRYDYDNQNRILKITYPDGSFTGYAYGQVVADDIQSGEEVFYRTVTETQRNGTVVKHYYDQLQRLMKREITPAGSSEGTTLETYEYDGLSRLNKAVDNDTVVQFEYDRANRLIQETQGGKLIKYTYDELNNQLSLRYPNDRLIEQQFDQLNRMNLVKESGRAVSLAEMKHIGRSYRLLSKQYGNGDVVQYLYDQGRRLTDQVSKNKTDNLINQYKYGYNKVHMKTFEQRMHDSGQGNTFEYDELYRLKNMKFNVPDPTVENPTEFEKEKSIGFDKVDNILNIVENISGQTKTITTDIPSGTTYEKLNQYANFDQWGLSYDLNGNTVQKGTQHFTYDYRNQLVREVDGTNTTLFKYDVMGRRTQKQVTTGTQTGVTNYYYSGNRVIEERDGTDTVLNQYIYGNGIDEVIRLDKYSDGSSTPYYYHTDGIGSVTAITDSNGNVIERVTYDIYGMPIFWDAIGNEITESSIGNRILLQGREYDSELNLYNYRARHYDPIMGRFLQTDPMGYKDSLNLYQAFGMNPVNFSDPMGTESNRSKFLTETMDKYNKLVKWGVITRTEANKQIILDMKTWEEEYKESLGKSVGSDTNFINDFLGGSWDKIKQIFGYLPGKAKEGGEKLWTQHLQNRPGLNEELKSAIGFLDENYVHGCEWLGEMTGEAAELLGEEIQYGIIFGSIKLAKDYIPKYDELKKLKIKNFESHHILPEYLGKMMGYTKSQMRNHPGILISQFSHTGRININAFHKIISKYLPAMKHGRKAIYSPKQILEGLNLAYEEIGRPELFKVIEDLIRIKM